MCFIKKSNVDKKLVLKYFENSASLFGFKLVKSKKGYRYSSYVAGREHNFTITFTSRVKEIGNYYNFKPIKAKNVVCSKCDCWFKCSTETHASFYAPKEYEYSINMPYTEEVNKLVFKYLDLEDPKKYYKVLRQSHMEITNEIFSIAILKNGKVVAYAELIKDGKYLFIFNVAVDEKQKYVDELKSVLLKLLVKQGHVMNCDYVYAVCDKQSKRALYKLNGFEEMFQAYKCTIMD